MDRVLIHSLGYCFQNSLFDKVPAEGSLEKFLLDPGASTFSISCSNTRKVGRVGRVALTYDSFPVKVLQFPVQWTSESELMVAARKVVDQASAVVDRGMMRPDILTTLRLQLISLFMMI